MLNTDATLASGIRNGGTAVGVICDHIHQHEGAAGIPRILGVLALARQHGPGVVEDAATAALDLGVPTYRFLRKYLDRRPRAAAHAAPIDPLIRSSRSIAI